MINRRSRPIGVVLVGLVLASGSLTTSLRADSTTGPTQWMTDYSKARNESRRLGLPLVIHFSATWCGPCRQMERETLHSPALMGLIGTKLLALKIDSDANPGLVDLFRVEALPSDIIVGPDGRIVARNGGYQSHSQYLATISHWSGQFPQERTEALARLQPPRQQTLPVETPQRSAPPRQTEPVNSSRPNSEALVQVDPSRGLRDDAPSARPQRQEPTPLVGLDGYCPVQIRDSRRWVRGQKDLAVNWHGVVYYLADKTSLETFKSAPPRYAPRMLGCDPVELLRTDRAVQGSVQYGAFFDRELYLFSSLASRDQFKRDPERFTQIRHALRSEDVIGTRLR
jgi:YHS domain-containing protein/thiol-disulfide isomerase/thioredoxin